MTLLDRLQRAYDVHCYGPRDAPHTWLATCLRCPMRYRLVVGPAGPTPTLLEPLWEHARAHEEVTRKVRLARTRQPP